MTKTGMCQFERSPRVPQGKGTLKGPGSLSILSSCGQGEEASRLLQVQGRKFDQSKPALN